MKKRKWNERKEPKDEKIEIEEISKKIEINADISLEISAIRCEINSEQLKIQLNS